ncbi:caspase Dronc [Drosophila novamexicana]|uniref:caspase Dronc n=1 Tax=Drosophila novamexicana TaxID=47314 RepID=UPI0011E5AE02|nr:caspase Dronc [Drosophila novamexicana]
MEEERERERDREVGMKQKHRQHIMRNMDKLIKYTSYKDLVAETVRRGLISPVMRRNIEDLNEKGHNMTEEQVQVELLRKYFVKITKRGPTAYAELMAILRSLGYSEALRILEEMDPQGSEIPFLSLSRMHSNKSTDIVDTCLSDPPVEMPSVSNVSAIHNDADGPLVPFEEPVQGKQRIVVKSTRIHTDDITGTYPMKSQHNRGVLLIVNIIDFSNPGLKRKGAEGDGDSLIDIFRQIGFKIFSYKNLDQRQFFNTLSALTSSQFVRDTESFVMVLMTHGERAGEVDRVQFSDGSLADVKAIINSFRSDLCPNLVHKPKVLIFPFCRGDNPDHGQILPKMMRMRIQTDGVPFDNVPTLSDILICYASTPGFETHRDTEEGSWYIQKFCDTMAEHAHDRPLEDILKKTHSIVGNMRTKYGHLQTGVFEGLGFNKKLYFNPGFFVSD